MPQLSGYGVYVLNKLYDLCKKGFYYRYSKYLGFDGEIHLTITDIISIIHNNPGAKYNIYLYSDLEYISYVEKEHKGSINTGIKYDTKCIIGDPSIIMNELENSRNDVENLFFTIVLNKSSVHVLNYNDTINALESTTGGYYEVYYDINNTYKTRKINEENFIGKEVNRVLELKKIAEMKGLVNIDNEIVNKINWYELSKNPNSIHILENCPDKIDWKGLSSNPNALPILEKNLDKIDWAEFSRNPNAIPYLERNKDKIRWKELSSNPNAIHILKQNMDKIDWTEMSSNPNIHFLIA